MLFARRERPFLQRFRNALWPRTGWARACRYHWKRLMRVAGSPHAVAAGAAAGVFAAATPFLGLQWIIGALLTLALRGSLVAMFVASFVGNPLTYPIMWGVGAGIGGMILGPAFAAEIAAIIPPEVAKVLPDEIEEVAPLIGSTAVGSLVVGGVLAFATYLAVGKLVRRHHVRRSARLRARRRFAGAAA